jgi:Trypsin
MFRYSIALVSAIAALAHTSGASAITRGTPDLAHPMVAALGALDPHTGLVFRGCGATLVSNTVLLTAGHCVSPFAGAPPTELLRVNFRQDASPDAAGWQPVEAAFAHPGLTANRGTTEDVGVVVIADGAAPDVPHATLPEPGRLSTLAAGGGLVGVSFDLVGYGCDHVGHASGPSSGNCDSFVRKFATAPFGGLTQKWLELRTNWIATGEGGQCLYDSGSPEFLAGTLDLVAVTTAGDRFCRDNNINYRLDTPSARAFLADYVALP